MMRGGFDAFPTGRPVARGRFIVFEGIDGSGKSSTMASVAEALDVDGGVWTTAEETDSYLGEAVRRSIEEHADPMATAYLFLADRARHVPEIRRHLEVGKTVLCDRFMHSTLAYQGVTLADRMRDPMAFLRFLHTPIGLEPDRVLLFDVDPETALSRIGDRDAKARYEKAAFLQKVRANYRLLAAGRPDMFTIIDASQDQATVRRAALQAVEAALP